MDSTANNDWEIGKWHNSLHKETEPDSTHPIEPKMIPLIQFCIGEDQKFKMFINNGLYTDKTIFEETINEMKSWFEYQIPHMEKTFKDLEESKKLNNKS